MKKIILLSTFFVWSFILKAQINSTNFGTRTDFSIGNNGAINITTGDMDGDGKKDVVVANQTTGVISIFRNTSTTSTISFATRIDSAAAGQLAFIHLIDFDGDGKLDIAVSANTGTSNFVVVYKNVSTTGNILIGSKQIFSLGTLGGNSSGMWTGDLDGDGKADIVTSNYSNTSYSVLRNTSTSGTISFGSAATSSTSVANPSQLILSDVDGDSKSDMVIFINGTNVLIYRNTTTTTSITFSSSPVTLTTGSGAHRGDIADVDGDGKLDIACSNYNNSNSSVFRNTSTIGSISFASQIVFQAPINYIQSTLLKDLDMDGKPELIQSTGSGTTSAISISRNFANSGSINSASFGTRMDFTSASAPTGLNVTDIDGDGKPEILSANFSAASFSVFKNDVVPAPPGLAAYYPFTGNAGDSSGFGNHGTVTGATLTTDRFGSSNSAYNFNGSSNKIGFSPTYLLLNTYTYSVWVNIASLPTTGNLNSILDIGSTTADQFIYVGNAGTLGTGFGYASYNSTSTPNSYYTNALPSTGTWYHLVLTRATDSLKFYVNGTLVNVHSTASTVATYGSSSLEGWIGCRVSSIQFFNGKIDEARIYNRVLSQTEISQLYFSNNYYSKSTGPLDSLSTWGTNTDGSGTSPTSFGTNNTIYNVVNNSSPTISSNWYITGTNTAVVFGDGTNTLNTSIPSGLAFGADSMYVRNNVTYTVLGTLITNKPGFENGSTVQYTASGTQNILPATFYNLVVSGGTKSLVSNTTIKGTLAMLTNINCGTNTLTIGTSATQTGSITYGSGIVTGNLSRWFSASTNSGSTGLFPIGVSSIYRPVQIEYTSSPSSGGILTAIFTPTNPGSSGLNPALTDFSISPIVSVNKAGPNGYWTITPSGGISGGTYTTTVTGTGFYGISSVTGLRLLRRSNSSSAWALTGSAVTPTGTTSIPVVSRTSITSIGGDFGIGADSSVNPLPIIITEFEAKVISKNNVQLNWITSSEINSSYFDIERLIENSQWSIVGKVKGNGTTNVESNYQFVDPTFNNKQQTSNTIYYRLKQVDFDGIGAYSKTVSVNINSLQQQTSIYPNPNDGNFIIENDLAQNSNITISIINLLGEKVWSNSYQLQAGKNSIEVKANLLSPGIYFLRIEDESKQINEVQKVLLK